MVRKYKYMFRLGVKLVSTGNRGFGGISEIGIKPYKMGYVVERYDKNKTNIE